VKIAKKKNALSGKNTDFKPFPKACNISLTSYEIAVGEKTKELDTIRKFCYNPLQIEEVAIK